MGLEVSIILCRRKAKNLHGRIRPAGSRKKCEDAKHEDAREVRDLAFSKCSYNGDEVFTVEFATVSSREVPGTLSG
jgi:hypothetical protein